jgi:hypothetical protein
MFETIAIEVGEPERHEQAQTAEQLEGGGETSHQEASSSVSRGS